MSIFKGRLSRKNFGLGFFVIILPLPLLGIFAAIILASLSVARSKSADAQVKVYMQQARAQAEIFWALKGEYTDLCEDLETRNFLSQAAAVGSGDAENFGCYSFKDGYVAVGPLKTSGYACIDNVSSGKVIFEINNTGSTCADFPAESKNPYE